MLAYWRLLLPSEYAAWTPLTPRIVSSEPAGTRRA